MLLSARGGGVDDKGGRLVTPRMRRVSEPARAASKCPGGRTHSADREQREREIGVPGYKPLAGFAIALIVTPLPRDVRYGCSHVVEHRHFRWGGAGEHRGYASRGHADRRSSPFERGRGHRPQVPPAQAAHTMIDVPGGNILAERRFGARWERCAVLPRGCSVEHPAACDGPHDASRYLKPSITSRSTQSERTLPGKLVAEGACVTTAREGGLMR